MPEILLTKLSGKLLNVACSASSVVRTRSVKENALDNINNVDGTWLVKCKSSHCDSSLLSLAGLTPIVRMPRDAQAAWSSGIVSDSMPSDAIIWLESIYHSSIVHRAHSTGTSNISHTLSSAFICCIRFRTWYRKKLSVPKALMPIYRHMDTNCGRDKLSNVSSSSKSFAMRIMSPVSGCSPVVRIYKLCARQRSCEPTGFGR